MKSIIIVILIIKAIITVSWVILIKGDIDCDTEIVVSLLLQGRRTPVISQAATLSSIEFSLFLEQSLSTTPVSPPDD